MTHQTQTAYLFSGQGSQYPGMGQEFYNRFDKVKELYAKASDAFGFDLARTAFEGTEAELSQTMIAQPLIYTMSLAVFEVLQSFEEIPSPSCVAGHSLGEYAAMTAAGILTLEDGFQVIKARAAAMQKASEQADGSMFAIVGSTQEAILKACQEAGGYVVPVNYNSPVQTVIAGESAAAGEAARLLAESGAKTVKLAVSCAFHSQLMEGAAQELKDAVSHISFHKPVIPFYSNLDGSRWEQIDADYLARHLISPVRFVEELQRMSADGVTAFIEAGPGKVLTGLVKKTLKGANAVNVENDKTLEKAVASFSA